MVVNSATNAGIPHALVNYFGAGQGFRFTDTGGNFQVENVPCLFYSLAVSKPGFVSAQEESAQPGLLMNTMLQEAMENQSEQPGSAPRPANISVNLKADSQPARIPLMPVASISGTVVDENSEPLAGVAVQGIVAKTSLSGTDYVPARTARTDDRGRYELLGLPPGDYIVRLAGEAASTHYFTGTLNPNNDHRGMQPVYYPRADSLSAASIFHLAPAAQANADFRQATEPAFDVNGRLSGFIPQAWTRLRLYRDGDRLPVGTAFVNLTTGQFRLTDIPHGSYTLRVEQYQADPPLWLAAEEPVTITSEPIRNLVVQLSGAVDIPVSVSYEAGAQDEEMIQLILQPQHSRENLRQLSVGKGAQEFERLARLGNTDSPEPSAKPVPPSQPKAFTGVIPDRYKLTVMANGVAGYVASAKLGDLDVLHGEFAVGSAVGELHVTIRGDSATVQGQVTFQGQPVMGAQVYLIPTTEGESPKFGFGDQEGHYEIKGVPPGDYRIRAWTGPPTAKEIMSGAGDTLTLQASEQRTMALEATAATSAVQR
jgi:Carboxypeptidase regulatory-like domain